MDSENCILFDWVSITSKIHSPQNFIYLLGLALPEITWEIRRGAHGYRDCLFWEHISIHYNGREDMGVWLEMTGQGCRAFETFGTGDYLSLFQEVFDEPDEVHFTRLDVAFDDHSGILPLQQIAEDTLELRDGVPACVVSKFRSRQVEWQHYDGDSRPGLSVYYGRKVSDCLIRIYDKAAERHFFDRHWVRVELQLRDERALAFAQQVASGADIGEIYRGVIYNYLRYVDPDPLDSNRWRWPMKGYWADFLGAAARIRLWRQPGADYNILNCEEFVFHQAGAAVHTLLEIYGIEVFLQKLKEQRGVLSAKYQRLLAEHTGRCYNEFGEVQKEGGSGGTPRTQQNKKISE